MRIVFFISEDWYFLSHRVALARAAARDGWEVHLITNRTGRVRIDPNDPFEVHWLQVDRSSVNPIRSLAALFELRAMLRSIAPDLVHNVALKPIVVGTLAARLAGVPSVINAVAGMGFVFSSGSAFARLIRPFVGFALSRALRSRDSHVVVQNRDDGELVLGMGVPPERVSTIRGSGVDTDRFVPPATEPPEPLVVRFLARLLEDKGARDFVEAARSLRPDFPDARFVLSGDADEENPASISRAELAEWRAGGIVELTGRIDDVAAAWHASHVAVLPSYREGLPRSLLEAAACGRPIVTTDVPGCREVVIDGYNGTLVPVKDPEALAAAMRALLLDPGLRRTMGAHGVDHVREELSQSVVDEAFLALYRSRVGRLPSKARDGGRIASGAGPGA